MWDEGTLEYGSGDRQTIELALPPIGAAAANGLAVLVHGGEGAGGTAKAMEPLGVNLMAHGWAVANIEHDVDSAQQAEEDVATGLREARAWWAEMGGTGPLIGVGPGEGGRLVLAVAEGGRPVSLGLETQRDPGEGADAGARRGLDGVVALEPELPAGVGPDRVERPVCLVLDRDEGERSASAEAAARMREIAPDLRIIEARRLSRELAIDPHGDHWPEVAKWIRDATGARSDPLGDKPLR